MITTISTYGVEDLDKVIASFRKQFPRGGWFGLQGGLGAGKTTFVRALIADIARETGRETYRVPSPSYVFHQTYPELTPSIDHFDLYRLDPPVKTETLTELGLFEAMDRAYQKQGYVFVEWAERSPDFMRLAETVVEIQIRQESRDFSWSGIK